MTKSISNRFLNASREPPCDPKLSEQLVIVAFWESNNDLPSFIEYWKNGTFMICFPKEYDQNQPQDPMLILQQGLLRITTTYHKYEQLKDKDWASISFKF